MRRWKGETVVLGGGRIVVEKMVGKSELWKWQRGQVKYIIAPTDIVLGLSW